MGHAVLSPPIMRINALSSYLFERRLKLDQTANVGADFQSLDQSEGRY
jgi:hypothetical protein